MGAPARSAGTGSGRADRRLVTETDGAGSDRRALAVPLPAWVGARLGARDEAERTGGPRRVAVPRFLPERPRLPARVRAVRRGFPVSVPRGGRLDAPRPPAGGGLGLASGGPAGAGPRGRGRGSSGRWPEGRNGRALRGWTLARHLRRLSRDGSRTGGSRSGQVSDAARAVDHRRSRLRRCGDGVGARAGLGPGLILE